MYEKALEVCRAGLAHHSDYLSARVLLGLLLLKCGHPKEAQEELEVVLQVSPTNLIARRALADLYRDSENLDRARKAYEEILWLVPGDREALEGLESIGAAGKAAATETDWTRSAERMEDLPAENAGQEVAPGGDKRGAGRVGRLQTFRESPFPELADVDISDPTFTRTLARLHEEQGRYQQALTTYRMILKENPDDETIRQKVKELEKGPEGKGSLSGSGSTASASLSEEKAETALERGGAREAGPDFGSDLLNVSADIDVKSWASPEPTPTGEAPKGDGPSTRSVPAGGEGARSEIEDLVKPGGESVGGAGEDWVAKLDDIAADRGDEPTVPPAVRFEEVPPPGEPARPASFPGPAAGAPSEPARESGSQPEETIRRLEEMLERIRARKEKAP